MSIVNPTSYTIRKIHSFDIVNEHFKQRIKIDVLEDLDDQKPNFTAIPFLAGYLCNDTITGKGNTVEEALSDCLDKIKAVNWEDLTHLVMAQQTVDPV